MEDAPVVDDALVCVGGTNPILDEKIMINCTSSDLCTTKVNLAHTNLKITSNYKVFDSREYGIFLHLILITCCKWKIIVNVVDIVFKKIFILSINVRHSV